MQLEINSPMHKCDKGSLILLININPYILLLMFKFLKLQFSELFVNMHVNTVSKFSLTNPCLRNLCFCNELFFVFVKLLQVYDITSPEQAFSKPRQVIYLTTVSKKSF